MIDAAIRIEGLGKRYRYGGAAPLSYNLRQDIADWAKGLFRRDHKQHATLHEVHEKHIADSPEYFWALQGIDLEIKRGDSVGIIGSNGAGKSTLLKILSRITPPTTGKVTMHGRVASLLEVGTGFHRELTGRENIFLNGSILGMRRTEIAKKFDEIVDFAEVEKFIDTPVKFYSSGMYVRLAFAVAAYLEPEILIVDEVLAVGDAAFQKKCLGKMGEVAKGGRTVLFVSHNMAAVQRLCHLGVWLKAGKVVALGPADEVVGKYMQASESTAGEFRAASPESAPGDARLRLLRVSVRNARQEVTDTLSLEAPFSIELEYQVFKRVENVRIGFRLVAGDGSVVFTTGDTDPLGIGITREPGTYIGSCQVPGNLLNNGHYYITAASDIPMQEVILFAENLTSFNVLLTGGAGSSVSDNRQGVIRPTLPWKTRTGEAGA